MRTQSLIALPVLLFCLLSAQVFSTGFVAQVSAPLPAPAPIREQVSVEVTPGTSPPPPPPPPPPRPDDKTIPPPEPPGPDGEQEEEGGGSTEVPPPVIVIMVELGEFHSGTEETQIDYGSSDMTAVLLSQGVGQSQTIAVVSAHAVPYCELEQYLVDQGEIDPSTTSPNGGYDIGYHVSITSHVSGDPSSPNSVGIVSVTVTDNQGNIVFEDRIIGGPGSGSHLPDGWTEAAAHLNSFFESLLTQ